MNIFPRNNRNSLLFLRMALFVTSLNSGSNGNCYYIGNREEAVLIDAGLSLRETERRMSRLGLDMRQVKAIFISHEHSDHITGLPGISKKFQLPVYISEGTYSNLGLPLEEHLVVKLKASENISIGKLHVSAFLKFHDAAEPHSFMITDGKVHIGVFTDIGKACNAVVDNFKKCHAVFLESNYCPNMLENGRYPYFLKERIRNGNGHLSNVEALELFTRHKSPQLSHLFLSHLSRNNNSMELVERLFTAKAGKTNIIIASRYKETPVFFIEAVAEPNKNPATYTSASQTQLSLF